MPPTPATLSRRQFAKLAALGMAAAPLLGRAWAAAATEAPAHPPLGPISIFSKHLQFLDCGAMAEQAARMGFDGVDLAVRPGGHVEPENVEAELPRALAAIAAVGLRCDCVTTAVEDAASALDRRVLETAAEGGARFYRMNWFRYPDGQSLPETLDSFGRKVAGLADLNRQLGLVGCYQNHAGEMVGASIWEVWRLLEGADPERFGFQYDIRHATVEGGLSWPVGLRLAAPRIKTFVLKDFKWIERDGRNEILNTPLGEGAVDFPAFFRFLKINRIHAPMTLHLEYPLGGAEHGARELAASPEAVYEAMEKDLAAIKRLWATA